MNLFKHPVSSYVASVRDAAIRDVKNFSEHQLADPALAGYLDAIAAKHTPKPPLIGAPSGADKIADPTIQVSIPIKGDMKLMELRPSQTNDPGFMFHLHDTSLVVTVPDDDTTQACVSAFCKSISISLQSLAQDLEKGFASLRADLDAVAAERLSQIKAEKARHAKLGFPVRDSRN